jgi:hypothetical protein
VTDERTSHFNCKIKIKIKQKSEPFFAAESKDIVVAIEH